MADTNAQARPKEAPREFNPRWKGYLFILVASLVNFSSISNLNVEEKPHFQGMYQASLMFGVVTFIMTTTILALDRFQYCCSSETANNCNFTQAMDGKMEGYTLLGLTLWWIIGVAHITQVEGIAYVANNIYFSSWFTLAACIYTLDKWSAAKDILSIEELTGLSATLKSWYYLFLASLVTFGTSADLHSSVADDFKSSAAYGIVLGLISSLVSFFIILVHYRLIDFECLQVGGWMELSLSFSMTLLWIIGVAILTSEGGVAATIGGSGCTARSSSSELRREFGADECYVIWDPVDDVFQDNSDSEQKTEGPTSMAPTMTIMPTGLPTQTWDNETALPTANNTTTPTADPSIGAAPTGTPIIEAPTGATPSAEVVTTGALQNLRTSSPTIATVTETNLTETNNEVPLDPNEEVPLDPNDEVPLDPNEEVADADDAIFEGDNEGLGGDETLPNDSGFGNTSNATTNATAANSANETTDEDVMGFAPNLTSLGNGTSSRRLQEVQLVGVNLEPTRPNATANNETFDNITWSDIPSQSPSHQPSSFPSAAPSVYFNKMSCIDVLDRQIPGSNLYLASWICFFAAFNVTLRWKAAQALQFAQAQHRKADEQAGQGDDDDIGSDRDDDEGDVADNDTSYGEEEDNL